MPYQIISLINKVRIEYKVADSFLPTWLVFTYSILALCFCTWVAFDLFYRHKVFQNLAFPPLGSYLLLFTLLSGSCAQSFFWKEEKLNSRTILEYDSLNKSFNFSLHPVNENSKKLNFSESEFYCYKLDISVNSRSSSQSKNTPSGLDVRYNFYLVHDSGLEFPLYRDGFVLKSTNSEEERNKGRAIVSKFFEIYNLFPKYPIVDGNTGFEIDRANFTRTNNQIYPKIIQFSPNDTLKFQIETLLLDYTKETKKYVFPANTSDNYLYIFLFIIGLLVFVGILHALIVLDFDSKGGFVVTFLLLVFPAVLIYKSYVDFQEEAFFIFSVSSDGFSILEKNKEEKETNNFILPTQGGFLFWDWYSHKSLVQAIPLPDLKQIQNLEFKKHPNDIIGLSTSPGLKEEELFDLFEQISETASAYTAIKGFEFQRLFVSREVLVALYLQIRMEYSLLLDSRKNQK